jgi:outer membrane protein assembly factor BamE
MALPVRSSLALTAALALTAVLPLAGCSSGSSVLARPAQWLTPYRPDVVQGNFIAAEQVAQLKPGLSRLQVRNLLGTPLVSSIFHADRWDYVFSLRRGSDGQVRLYRYTVFFEGDALVKFEGDAMPSETEFVAQFSQQPKGRPVPSLQATPEQLEAARASAARPAAEPAASPAPVPAPAPASYPPLEGARP